MAAILDGSELTLTGTVGVFYFEDGFTHGDVVMALAGLSRTQEITVRLNSGGGIAAEGSAIYATLKARPGPVHVIVEGIAASAASVIAMAGSRITMAEGAVMMIHEPQVSLMYADTQTMASAAQSQQAYLAEYAAIYSERSGKSDAECREMMRAEVWMSGADAVAAGFADGRGEGAVTTVSAFDYRAYEHAPARLTALSRQKNWSLSGASSQAGRPALATRQPAEESMTEKERADQLAAENETLKADLAAAAAAREEETAQASASAAEIVEICAAAGVPAMASTLIREGLSPEAARLRASNVQEVRAAVDMARRSYPSIEANLADAFITAGLSMDQVRSKLFERMTAAQSPEISGAHQATIQPDDATATAASIVATIRPNRTKRSA